MINMNCGGGKPGNNSKKYAYIQANTKDGRSLFLDEDNMFYSATNSVKKFNSSKEAQAFFKTVTFIPPVFTSVVVANYNGSFKLVYEKEEQNA